MSLFINSAMFLLCVENIVVLDISQILYIFKPLVRHSNGSQGKPILTTASKGVPRCPKH